MAETIKISSLKIKFKEILDLVDKAIEERKKIEIPNKILKQNNNVILLFKWLQKHKIIDLNLVVTQENKKLIIKSRYIKIQIALQLKILESSMNEIAQIFGVKSTTAEGYLKEIANFNQEYSQILKLVLDIKELTKKSPLNEFPIFPIRLNIEIIKDSLKSSEYDKFKDDIKANKWIKIITGKDLGTQDLSILFPKKQYNKFNPHSHLE
jgi:hypothetical protein